MVAREGRPLPIAAVTRFGQVATCRVRRDRVVALAEHPDVDYISAGLRMTPSLFEICASGAHCSARTSAPTRGVGSGVALAFLDWGIDFTHRAVRDRSGRTRLQAIWDQRDDLGNNRYGYGTVYSRTQIDQALLDDQPFSSLGYAPQTGPRPSHGTHVVDIAAGSSGMRLGLAPSAELIFVHLASSSPGPGGDLGDSVRVIEALDFVIRAAGDWPLVIHMSLGTIGRQAPVELALEHLLEVPGRAVVQSAGIGPITASKNAIVAGASDAGGRPDIVAPSTLLAARSAERGTREGTAEVVAMSGSSVASAQVAGRVAAMFSAALPRRLSIFETRRRLLESRRGDHSTGGVQ